MTEIPIPPNHPSQAGPVRAKCGSCGKTVAVRKDGTYWHHRSLIPEWPGSPFKKLCANSGITAEAGES